MFQTLAFAALALFAGAAAAQQPARPDPADAKAAVPALRYDSAFKAYRPYAEPEIARWRDVNDEMTRLGGHAGHMPQAARQETSSPKSSPKTAAPSGHGGHK